MMQVQNQPQQISEEEFLLPLSEDEQDAIHGGILPLIAAVGINVAGRVVVRHLAGRAVAAGRGIASGHRRVNAYGRRNPVTTGVVLGGAGVGASYYVGSRRG